MGDTIFMEKHQTLISNNPISIFQVLYYVYLKITSLKWVKHYLIEQIYYSCTGIIRTYVCWT